MLCSQIEKMYVDVYKMGTFLLSQKIYSINRIWYFESQEPYKGNSEKYGKYTHIIN